MKQARNSLRKVAACGLAVVAGGVSGATTNVWQAASAGNASDAANWSLGLPSSAQVIRLDGTSVAAMTWNHDGANGLPDTVAGWVQAEGYTNTVTFPIQYPGVPGAAFTNLTVTGDVSLQAGTWTHTANGSTQAYRLAATIDGLLSVGAAGTITANGKGYYNGGKNNACHGGNANNVTGSTYGNPTFPVDLGASYTTSAGGGAIFLDVGGGVWIDGSVLANGVTNSVSHGGAGGSILIRAPSVGGAGTISANGAMGTKVDYTGYAGSGGRIALLTTDVLAFPTNKVTAYGRATGSTTGYGSGAGTVFLKNAGDTHGTLIVNNSATGQSLSSNGAKPFGKNAVTPVNGGETWTFDRVLTQGYGVLSVPTGTTLVLPGGLASVSSLDATTPVQDGLRYDGGTLDIGAFATHMVSGGWCFQAASPYTLQGNLVVTNGASVGLCRLRQVAGEAASLVKCDLTVTGNMTVDATSFIEARYGGFWDNNATYYPSTHGGFGGRSASTSPYGSILHPALAAGGDAHGGDFYAGGGVVKLTVQGNLELQGVASAAGLPATADLDTKQPSAGGSLEFTLGSLSGTGTVSSVGGHNARTSGSSGGRVAVRLTGSGSTFGTWPSRINAYGRTRTSSVAQSGGAGTVYLETASDGPGGGLLIVRNDNNANNLLTTPIPAPGTGADAASSLAGVALVAERWGRVRLTSSLGLASATLDAASSLDLAGFTLTLRSLSVAGSPVGAGTYAAADLGSQVVDSSVGSGGWVVVVPSGTMLLVR